MVTHIDSCLNKSSGCGIGTPNTSNTVAVQVELSHSDLVPTSTDDIREEPCFFEDERGVPPYEYADFFDRVDAVVPSGMWKIIERWKAGLIDSNQALGELDSNEMLDPDALMWGWAAYQTAMAKRPPHPPRTPAPVAPGAIPEPAMEVLEALARNRVA